MTTPKRTLDERSFANFCNMIKHRGRGHVKYNITKDELAILKSADKCGYCGSSEIHTVDHIIPVFRDGHTSFINLVTCCWDCNINKGLKLPHKWLDKKHNLFYNYLVSKNISFNNFPDEVKEKIRMTYEFHKLIGFDKLIKKEART